MKIRIKYFPPYDTIINTRTDEIELPYPITLKEFLKILLELHPQLQEFISFIDDETLMSRIIFAQNGEFLKLDNTINEGEVLVLPPISGG